MKIVPVSEQIPFLGDLGESLYELTNHADREMAIIGGAYIERCLELAISAQIKVFNKSFNSRKFHKDVAPSFSNKIDMAIHIGVVKYDNEIHGLRTIQGLRNRFAHYVKKIDCDSPEISKELDKIKPSFFCDIEKMKSELIDMKTIDNHRYSGRVTLRNGVVIDLANTMLITSKDEKLLFSAPEFKYASDISNKDKLALCIHLACFSLVGRICQINFDIINESL